LVDDDADDDGRAYTHKMTEYSAEDVFEKFVDATEEEFKSQEKRRQKV
jgi:hypothetical protein